MDRNELISKLEAFRPEMVKLMRQFGAHDPDWKPLERVLPQSWCAGFMFMGYDGEIRMYKQGFTRNYLLVDPSGKTYMYLGEDSPARYAKIPRRMAIERAFRGIEGTGAKRHTPFDERARRRRQEAFEKAGWKVVTVDASEEL